MKRILETHRSTKPGLGSWVPGASVEAGAAVDEKRREEEKEEGRPLRVGLVCGGPSAERGISLNSARSVLDHIQVCFLRSR